MKRFSSTSRVAVAIFFLHAFPVDLPTEGGWLGITVQNITPTLAFRLGLESTRGVIINRVLHGGPASRAGIQQGDVLLAFDGKRLENASQLRRLVEKDPPGKRVNLTLIRRGREMVLSVILGKAPQGEV